MGIQGGNFLSRVASSREDLCARLARGCDTSIAQSRFPIASNIKSESCHLVRRSSLALNAKAEHVCPRERERTRERSAEGLFSIVSVRRTMFSRIADPKRIPNRTSVKIARARARAHALDRRDHVRARFKAAISSDRGSTCTLFFHVPTEGE